MSKPVLHRGSVTVVGDALHTYNQLMHTKLSSADGSEGLVFFASTRSKAEAFITANSYVVYPYRQGGIHR
jgi:hypothetical protein